MIKTKAELKNTLNIEKNKYFTSRVKYIKNMITRYETYYIYKYQKLLRKCEYYYNRKKFLRYLYYYRKKSTLGAKIGINIPINVVDTGLRIFHCGNIVINAGAKIGKNIALHGCNCVGINTLNKCVPTIGDNCDLGFGSMVIGDVTLGDNCIVGANSFVNKSFEDNSIIVGSPGKKIKNE